MKIIFNQLSMIPASERTGKNIINKYLCILISRKCYLGCSSHLTTAGEQASLDSRMFFHSPLASDSSRSSSNISAPSPAPQAPVPLGHPGPGVECDSHTTLGLGRETVGFISVDPAGLRQCLLNTHFHVRGKQIAIL